MAFTIGTYGSAPCEPGRADITFYATALLFVLLVLGAIAHLAGFQSSFIGYIKDELLIVLGTSSPRPCCRHDAEDGRLGASRPVVGLGDSEGTASISTERTST